MMRPPFLQFALTILVTISAARAQEPPATNDEIELLRTEIRKTEFELEQLAARLKELKERLARIDAKQSPSQSLSPPALRFPIEIERAMMGEAIRRAPSAGGKGGPGNFAPVPMPRR